MYENNNKNEPEIIDFSVPESPINNVETKQFNSAQFNGTENISNQYNIQSNNFNGIQPNYSGVNNFSQFNREQPTQTSQIHTEPVESITPVYNDSIPTQPVENTIQPVYVESTVEPIQNQVYQQPNSTYTEPNIQIEPVYEENNNISDFTFDFMEDAQISSPNNQVLENTVQPVHEEPTVEPIQNQVYQQPDFSYTEPNAQVESITPVYNDSISTQPVENTIQPVYEEPIVEPIQNQVYQQPNSTYTEPNIQIEPVYEENNNISDFTFDFMEDAQISSPNNQVLENTVQPVHEEPTVEPIQNQVYQQPDFSYTEPNAQVESITPVYNDSISTQPVEKSFDGYNNPSNSLNINNDENDIFQKKYEDINVNNEPDISDLYEDGIIKINMGDDETQTNQYNSMVSPINNNNVVQTNPSAENNKTEKNNISFILILGILIVLFILFLPTIVKIFG